MLTILFGMGSLALFWPANQALLAGKVGAFVGYVGLQGLLCLIAARLIWNRLPSRATVIIVVVLSILLRLPLLFQEPRLSDDMYRYIWDGRVQAAGINPYRYIPADPKLAVLRDNEIYPHINRRDYAHTIYPPVAQLFFFTVTRASGKVTWFKATLLSAEGVSLWVLARLLASFGLPSSRILIYGWNPLVLWEFSGSGHIDALMIAFVLLALLARRQGRDSLAGAWLSCAVLVKFIPLVLFPALYRRWDWKMPLAAAAVIGAGYLIYSSVGLGVFGFLPGYAEEEALAGGRYFPLLLVRQISGMSHLPVFLYLAIASAVLASLGAWSLFRRGREEGAFILLATALALTFTFLLSPIYPWYWTWLVPFLAFLPWRMAVPFSYLTVAALVRYGHWFDHGEWFGLHPQLVKGLVQFAPCALWLAFLALRQRRHHLSIKEIFFS
ncbi:MAG: glycosyltransferase family 87 protein [Chthoniobacterales bacterium]